MIHRSKLISRSPRLLLPLLLSTHLVGAAALDDYTLVHRQGPAEWSAAGDFNGDGFLDTAIVDRVTGTYRIGFGSLSGEHTWTTPRASGIPNVSGFTVGHLFSPLTHGLAFTAEAANRINAVPAENTAQAGLPVSIFGPSVGPNQVVAVAVGGAGDTPLHDFIVASVWNGVSPFRTTAVRNTDGSTFSTIQDAPESQRWDRGNRVVIRTGSDPVLAVIARGTNDTLRLVSYAAGPAVTVLQFTNLPAGADYTVGRFSNTGRAHFLAYRPGQTNFTAHPVLEPVPGTFAAGASARFNLDGTIESLVAIPASPGVSAKFLAILDGGSRAVAYAFDGTNAPMVVENFAAPEGRILSGATPQFGGGISIAAADFEGRTQSSAQYTFNPATGTFSLAFTEALPAVSDLSGRANVLQFQREPFVSTVPNLLHSGNAGDWSSLFSLAGGPPQVGVMSETFAGSSQGLDNPTPTSLGTSHPLASFGLANQYAEAVSIFNLSAAAGNEVVNVTAEPGGGYHARSVGVKFTTSAPGFQVLYRRNPTEAWQIYSGTAVSIYTNCTLQYRARAIFGTSQSSVRSEVYQFENPPGTLDSDADGVPDYVEIANGLDPVGSGGDGDGDGFSDLEELLKDTSPVDDSDHPLSNGFEQHAAVDWILTPRPLDGTRDIETAARGGSHVRAFDFSGSQLGGGVIGESLTGSAVVSNIFLDPQQPLLLAATDPHFDVVTPLKDARLGRELVAVLPRPVVPPITVNYVYGGAAGVLPAESFNWVTAARAAYNNATNEVRAQTLPIARTTIAVLLEEKLRRALEAASTLYTNVTLFSFRPADAGRQPFDAAAQALLQHGDATRPAYDLQQMLRSLEALVIDAPKASVLSLNAVTHEIYRIASASNNAAPGQYQPPLDVLREFVRGGGIHTNYLAAGAFPAPLLTDASAGAQFVLDHLNSRPVTNLNLRIRANTLAGGPCTTVETADSSATPVNLFALGGGAYDFPDTFQLLPGTVVQVTGHPDVSSTTCAGLNVEVLSVSLEAIPARSDGDVDGNLLIDSWEKMFLGGLGGDPFGDEDADGYNNLQEMFEGTDPRDGLGIPSGPIAAIKLPALAIEASVDGTVALEWTWPEAYRSKVQFQIWSTSDLNLPPTLRPIAPVHEGAGVHRAVLTNPGANTQFFKVVLQLKL